MRKEFLPFSRPSINAEDINAVTNVLTSGWLTTGVLNKELEDTFCDYTGCDESVALCSATAGMHLILKALNIGEGDEVITPSMTWVSTINLIVLSGATPVFADVDPNTLMVTKNTIEPCITDQTRLIIPVHFAGAPIDIGPIRELAEKKSIHLIEDAAHSIGTKYRGEQIGTTGTAVFSFHPIKNITTGEGGIICSDNKELISKIRMLKFHGLGVDAFDRKIQGRSPQAEVQVPGYKYNLTDMAAALGVSQMKRISDFNAKRQALATLYHDLLSDIQEITPLALPDNENIHAWHLFIVRLDIDKAAMSRDDFMEELKKRNIGTGIHFRAVHLQKYYRETMGFSRGLLPNTEWNSDRIVSLPLFPDMMPSDVSDVVQAIREVLKK